jgi:hypothetical protein
MGQGLAAENSTGLACRAVPCWFPAPKRSWRTFKRTYWAYAGPECAKTSQRKLLTSSHLPDLGLFVVLQQGLHLQAQSTPIFTPFVPAKTPNRLLTRETCCPPAHVLASLPRPARIVQYSSSSSGSSSRGPSDDPAEGGEREE